MLKVRGCTGTSTYKRRMWKLVLRNCLRFRQTAFASSFGLGLLQGPGPRELVSRVTGPLP